MTEISLQIEVDGVTIPGFPWLDARNYRFFFARQMVVSQLVSYTSAIPTLDTGESYRVGFLFLQANKALTLAVADSSVTNPISLAANRAFAIGGGNCLHTNAAPFVKFLPAATANVLSIVGIL